MLGSRVARKNKRGPVETRGPFLFQNASKALGMNAVATAAATSVHTDAPSGYCNASLSSFASASTVVPDFQAPCVSKRRSPMRRPHGEITRPIARKSVRSACSWSRRWTTSGATRMNARIAVADLMLYFRPLHAALNTCATCFR